MFYYNKKYDLKVQASSKEDDINNGFYASDWIDYNAEKDNKKE